MGGKSKLYEAIENNDLESIRYLVEQGANLRAYDDYALRLAAWYGHLEVVKYLLEQGANLHAKTTVHFDWLQKMAIWS